MKRKRIDERSVTSKKKTVVEPQVRYNESGYYFICVHENIPSVYKLLNESWHLMQESATGFKINQKMREKALSILKNAEKKHSNLYVLLSLFNYYHKLGDGSPENKKLMLQYANRAKELDAGTGLGYVALGQYYSKAKNSKHADLCFKMSCQQNSKFAMPRIKLAFQALRREDFSSCFNYASQATQLEPSNAYGWMLLGHCHLKGIGCEINHTKAFECAQNAVDKGPKVGVGWIALGLCYLYGYGCNPSNNEAHKCYQNATQQDPNCARGYYLLAQFYLQNPSFGRTHLIIRQYALKAQRLGYRYKDVLQKVESLILDTLCNGNI